MICMKGPGIKEYLAEIERRKLAGIAEGLDYIEITSKDIHNDLSKEILTMPTCCQAMYQKLLKEDQILQLPKGRTGYGSRLTVRYYLHDLDKREVMMEKKQRGRPKKYETEEDRPSYQKNWKTEKLIDLLSAWVLEQGCNIQEKEEDKIYATYQNGDKWILQIYGVRRGRKSTLVHKINNIFYNLEEEKAHYSLVLNDTDTYRKQWEEIPQIIKQKLNISIIVAGKDGSIEKL